MSTPRKNRAREKETAMAKPNVRIEHDLLGDLPVPADAYYGVQTARALENFQISGMDINHYPEFIDAFAIVKLAAARANTEVGAMKPCEHRKIHLPGRVGFINDDIALHRVRPVAGKRGISLHLYSKPIDECNVYDEATGLVVRSRLVYHSVEGVSTGTAGLQAKR